jgi:hyaluronan synthase
MFSKRKKKPAEDILLRPKPDRRLLAHVPDPERIRKKRDRRGDFEENSEPKKRAKRKQAPPQYARFAGQRYFSNFPVTLRVGAQQYRAKSVDVSQTGILLQFPRDAFPKIPLNSKSCRLNFSIPSGFMHEGMEKRYRIDALPTRVDEEKGQYGFQFAEPLFRYLQRRKDNYLFTMSLVFMLCISLFIILLRTESVLYFQFNKGLYLYSIVAATFLLSRYLFGAFYKPVPIDPSFAPSITIIIPCYNEEEWIRRTILSCIDQDYPVDKIEMIIVDDFSTDNSVEVIKETVRQLCMENERFRTQERIRVFLQKTNKGKREAMALGILNARSDLVVFVDSDSFLEPDAIVNLVQPFVDPKVAGVSGRTDVANTYTNWLTKTQAVRYYIAFRVLKAAESYFDSVMCLSGPLSAYRKSEVVKVLGKWVNQTFLGNKATFGDDRSLTNFIVKNNRTYYQDTAICSTIVPKKNKVFLKQQMRWKRSWLRESLMAARFMWRKEPLMSLSFYMGLVIPVAAPIIVIYNLIYIPIVNRVFPSTFLLGLLAMALMMSFAQLLLKKSKIWLYGFWFCVYYEAVLLWQMPWAWITFWVSTWGTRDTPQDTKRKDRRKARLEKRKQRRAARQGQKSPSSDYDPGANESAQFGAGAGSAERTVDQ